jgi:lipid-binding SYLF domain-containing protein
MKTQGILGFLAPVLALMVLAGCARLESEPPVAARHVIAAATATVERFTTVPQLAEAAKHIPTARAIVVFPDLVKAGFIAGGEGGNGVLLARAADGSWSQPVFLSLGVASFGLQAGIQQTEVVLAIRSDGALKAVLENQGSIGADSGITMAVYGAGIEGAVTTNAGADIVAFANSKSGLYAGFSLEGAVFIRRRDLNEAFYGAGATPDSILAGGPSNPAADPLIQALAAYKP